jgi:ABC-type Fe3+-hydroxamate transport system substrate-binding protein
VALKARVGREKDPELAKILALFPDLVIANIEENRKDVVEHLRAAGVPVWVTYPRTVRDGIRLIRELGEVTGADAAATVMAEPLEARYTEAARRMAERRPVRVFCPIWRDPYMTINRDTYVHDMLALCGGANVFADRAERYSTVTLPEVARAEPEVILLPDEPYRFRRVHLADFESLAEVPAIRSGRVHFVDGKLLSWYGPRIGQALEQLWPLLSADPPRG